MGTQNQQQSAAITLEAEEWTLKDLALQLKMPEPTLYAWLNKGYLEAKRIPVAGHRWLWVITADAQELERLRQLRTAQRTWVKHAEKVND